MLRLHEWAVAIFFLAITSIALISKASQWGGITDLATLTRWIRSGMYGFVMLSFVLLFLMVNNNRGPEPWSTLLPHEADATQSLQAKYPMGYFLFTGDSQTNFIRKNNQGKADFSIDWERSRVTFSDKSLFGVVLRNFHYYPTDLLVTDMNIAVERRAGAVADGLFFNGAGLFVELISDHGDELTYVIGIKRVNSVPKIRDINPDVLRTIRRHLNDPLLSAINTADKTGTRIDGIMIASGWTIADK